MNGELSNETAVSSTEQPVNKAKSVLQVDDSMIVLTWLAFIIAFVMLYKLTWKPILAVLDKRENMIRKSLEQADAAKKQADKTQADCKAMLETAQQQAQTLLSDAQKGAQELAASIQDKAREEARSLMANADREIKVATERAIAGLRRESVDMAVQMAEKVVRQAIPDTRKQALVDELIKEI